MKRSLKPYMRTKHNHMELLAIIVGLMWGSFLNVVAFRSIRNQSIIIPRSYCTHCKKSIAWYDNIPVFSWLLLRGSCRMCRQPISCLYPLIEIITTCALFALYVRIDHVYFLGYFIFISLLIITVRTDLEYMLIVPEFCLYPIAIAFLLASIGLLPINIMQSMSGAVIGYFSLWSIAKIYYAVTNRHGLGDGDFDLFALIGAFIGIPGLITSLLIGSWSGSIVGLVYLLVTNHATNTRIPFAPFLALGALIHLLFEQTLYQFFFCYYY